jgi:hypothetical protein
MLRLPCPGLLSVHRANFDARANKISTFLLFQKEVMGYRMMATQIRPTHCPPPPTLLSNMVSVTHVKHSIAPHLDLPFLISALFHTRRLGATRFGDGVEDGRKHVMSYLTKASPILTKTCQNQPSKGLGSRLSSTLLIIFN